jgi:hypothetical protein
VTARHSDAAGPGAARKLVYGVVAEGRRDGVDVERAEQLLDGGASAGVVDADAELDRLVGGEGAPPEARASAKYLSSFSGSARSASGCSAQISGSPATATNASWSEAVSGRSRNLGPSSVGWRSNSTG